MASRKMAKILHKKETGNLLCYFNKEIKSQEVNALEALQKWGLPIPHTLKISLSTTIEQKELEDLLKELQGSLQDWIRKKSCNTQIFSLSFGKDEEEETLFLSKVGLCPDLITSTNNLLTQQIHWLNLFTLLTTYGTCCLQIAKEEFERVKTDQKKYEGAYLDFDLSNSALEELIKEAQNKIEKKQKDFSYQAEILLQNALVHIIKTHFSKNALFAEGFNSFKTLKLTIQAETLSAYPAENADLVLYSKDPLSHKKEWTGEYLQGYERLLSSIYSIHPLSQTTRLRYGYLEESFEEFDQVSYTLLLKMLKKVPLAPNGYWKLCAQCVEGQIVFLTRSLVPSFDFEHYSLPPLYLHRMKRCARIPAISVSSGYAEGKVAFSLDYVKKCLDQKIPYILATEPSPNYLPLVALSSGLLIMGGGMTSALAEKAREIKIPALTRSKALFFHSQKKELYLGEYRIQEGDFISIDALSHTILLPLETCEKQKGVRPLA